MALKIHSGELRQVITFKKPIKTINTQGGREKTFEDFLSTRAAVKETSQSRLSDPSALLHTKDFIIRQREEANEITKDYLIHYGGIDYTINAVERIEEKDVWIRFQAKAKTSG